MAEAPTTEQQRLTLSRYGGACTWTTLMFCLEYGPKEVLTSLCPPHLEMVQRSLEGKVSRPGSN